MSPTMSEIVRAGLIAGIACSIAATSASSVYADVYKVQLGIKDSGGTTCPRDATLTAWAHSKGPGANKGTIFRIHTASGVLSGWTNPAIIPDKGPVGNWLATYTHTFKITANVDTKYRVEARQLYEDATVVFSNWVPLKAQCLKGSGIPTPPSIQLSPRDEPPG
jgi:hypothetical protein